MPKHRKRTIDASQQLSKRDQEQLKEVVKQIKKLAQSLQAEGGLGCEIRRVGKRTSKFKLKK